MSPHLTPIPFVGNPAVELWLNNIQNNMVIRRSLIGSLRQVASFSGSPVASTSLSEPTQSPTDARKRSNKSSPLAEQKPIKVCRPFIKPSSLAATQGEGTGELPQLDQSVNLVCLGKHSIDNIRIFEQCLPQVATNDRTHPLFNLPPAVRMEIYSHCFAAEPRAITLSPSFATVGAFEEDYFALPFDVLQDVCGGLEAFQAIRHELLTYFWTQFHFHVTLTPFTGPKFSPLSQIWLPEYLPIIQHLTLEVDFTRFGGGSFQGASDYGFYMEKTDRMLNDIMVGLSARRDTTIMTELNLLCRRYAGFRPFSGSELGNGLNAEAEEVPYCPELATLICDSTCEMRGLLQRFRLSGFTRVYTEMLMRSVYGEGDNKLGWFTASEPAWPLPPGFHSTSKNPNACISNSPLESSLPDMNYEYPSKTFSSSSLELPVSLSGSEIPPPKDPKLSPSEISFTELPATPISPLIPLKRLLSGIKSPIAPSSLNSSCYSASKPAIDSSSTSLDVPTTPLFGPYTDYNSVHPMGFSLKLSRSRSFRKDFEEQMLMSKYNSDHDGDHLVLLDTTVLEKEGLEAGKSEEVIYKSQDPQGFEEFELANTYDDEENSETAANSNSPQSCQDMPVPQCDSVISATPKKFEPLDLPEFSKNLQAEGRLTPIRQNKPIIPNSPNTMNQLNEKDPAFLRTLNAIRGRSSQTRIPGPVSEDSSPSFQNSPNPASQDAVVERWVTSLSNQSNNTKRRYLTFVNRFRG